MQFSLKAILLIIFGVLCLLSAFFNWKIRFGASSIRYNGLKELFGKSYDKFVSIVCGIVFILIGLYLLKK